jgi:hypothetical protein
MAFKWQLLQNLQVLTKAPKVLANQVKSALLIVEIEIDSVWPF